MNFAKTKEAVLSRAFEYKYEDADGTETVDTVSYTVKQSCATPKLVETLMRLQSDGKFTDIAKCLSQNIESWSLDWNGEPFPPSFENLSNVCDVDFMMAIIEDLSEVFAGKKKNLKQSANGSAV
jgi:hypothetical protein